MNRAFPFLTKAIVSTAMLSSVLSAEPASPIRRTPAGRNATSAPASAPVGACGLIAKGSRWQTPYYILDSKRPGPTVLLTAGLHGDEPAGAYAAEQIRHWSIRCGRLIVVPRCNVPGLIKRTRMMPGEPKGARNANRNFPKTGGPDEAVGALCKALWAFAARQRPDWHVDLHEGYAYRGAGSKSCGSSIIIWPNAQTAEAQTLMLEAVNATIDDTRKKMVAIQPPVNGSFARASAQRLGAKAMICETSRRADPTEKDKSKHQPLALRTRQHRIFVHRLLAYLRMVDCDVDRMLPARDPNGQAVRLAIYNGPGTSNSCFLRLEDIVEGPGAAMVRAAGPPEILAGALGQFDVVLFPGGSASRQARAIGETGREQVREFVGAGGGYVGICAGAYLATHRYTWSLKILDAYVVDRKHWRRGTGTIKMEMTPVGRRLLGGRAGLMDIYYGQGPLLAPAERPDLPDFTPLAHYRSEIAENGAPKGVMLNTPAIVAGRFGRGRVIACSPHPEKVRSEKGADRLISRAVQACASGPGLHEPTGRYNR